MPMGRMPRGALSLTGGTVHSTEQHKKPGQAAVQQTAVEAIAAKKLRLAERGGEGSWHPDGIVPTGASDAIALMVVEKERLGDGAVLVDGTAYVAPREACDGAVASGLGPLYSALQPTCLLQHLGGSDCAITVSAARPGSAGEVWEVPPGCLALDAVQRINLHVAHNTVYHFELVPSPPASLVDVELEAALLPPSMRLSEQMGQAVAAAAAAGACEGEGAEQPGPEPEGPDVVMAVADAGRRARLGRLEAGYDQEGLPWVTAEALRSAVSCHYFARCLALNEKVVVPVGPHAVLLRVRQVNDRTPAEQAELAVYHCHRGLLTAATEIYLVAEQACDGAGLRTVTPLTLRGGSPRDASLSRSEIAVETSDEEWFPVKRTLLQPCITLTASLRDRCACVCVSCVVLALSIGGNGGGWARIVAMIARMNAAGSVSVSRSQSIVLYSTRCCCTWRLKPWGATSTLTSTRWKSWPMQRLRSGANRC
jgi:hypothetical protein